MLALFFFALGLWWAYLTWCQAYIQRIAAAKNQFERLQQTRVEHSNGVGSASTDLTGGRSHVTSRSAAPTAFADSRSAGANSNLTSEPNTDVDWAGLPGIDADLASELKSMGIKNPEQLDEMSANAELNHCLFR